MHMKATISGGSLAGVVTVPAREWMNLGNALKIRIVNRTRAKNVDADMVPFKAYSPGYAKTKSERSIASRATKLVRRRLVSAAPSLRVNLTGVSSGQRMLDNIVVQRASAVDNPRLVLGFANAKKAEIALYHMGEGRVDREFFALSEQDIAFATDYIKARLQKAFIKDHL
jgi:hypothetical protein